MSDTVIKVENLSKRYVIGPQHHTVIKVENLSKRYVIGPQHQEHYVTLRDAIAWY